MNSEKPEKIRRTTKFCGIATFEHNPKYTEHEERLYERDYSDECLECHKKIWFSRKKY